MLSWHKDYVKGPFSFTKLGLIMEYIHTGFQLGYGDGFQHGLDWIRPLYPNHTYYTDDEIKNKNYLMETWAKEVCERLDEKA